MKKNKQIRIERIKERGSNNRSSQEQLDHLDSQGHIATKERAKLLKKIKDKKNANKDKKQKIQKKNGKSKRNRKG